MTFRAFKMVLEPLDDHKEVPGTIISLLRVMSWLESLNTFTVSCTL
jgi:hypothetical protein